MSQTTVQRAGALPRHVGIIMDGNGRWAKKRGLPRNMGHKPGADAFSKIARHAQKKGIAYLTVYAFSTENWSRPPEEVTAIMDLLRSFLKEAEKYKEENTRVKVLGDKTPLAADIRGQIEILERESASSTGMTLNIALNYGGRNELLYAAKRLALDFAAGKIDDLAAFGEEDFSRYLYTSGQPEVDLIIRTSGEMRVSNFMPWQGAYAEYVFTDTLWPDFTPRDFDKAIREFQTRTRRMGGI